MRNIQKKCKTIVKLLYKKRQREALYKDKCYDEKNRVNAVRNK